MKILTIIGARPQFIKMATVSRAIREHNVAVSPGQGEAIHEIIVHTGQHYDANMSDVFFDQLDIPRPDHHLSISGLSHGGMTGRMMERIEELVLGESPDWVLVYGDTNSTLAGALAASKLGVPIAHVEAGLRSHNPDMPEEINRVLTDRVARLLLCPTETAVVNLRREGFPFPSPGGMAQQIRNVGDVMYDAVLHYQSLAGECVDLQKWGLRDQEYVLCTLHRQENTDNRDRLTGILAALRAISRDMPVVLPLHPRTRVKAAEIGGDCLFDGLTLIEPVPYLEIQRLQMGALAILTDSGGMQKEAYFHAVPCITLRDETEWVETVSAGWNKLVGACSDRIISAFSQVKNPHMPTQPLYGDGHAAEKIVQALLD